MHARLPTLFCLMLGWIVILSAGAAMATEEPSYSIVKQASDYELRRYAAYRVAEVEVKGTFESVGGEAFRLLAGYIFGDNQGQTKIAMTAPVSQQPVREQGTRIEMTAPVIQTPTTEPERYRVSFIMPARYRLETLPRPNNPRIQLREEPARLVAARRYSGTWSEARYRNEEHTLLDALARDGLSPRGAPIYARYNSPFSLPMLRRNEILVEVDEPDSP